MSGLREEREFGEALVQGIRVLWNAQVLLAHNLVGDSMVADKQIDVVTAGLIAGNAGSHRVPGHSQYLCSTRSLWELAGRRSDCQR